MATKSKGQNISEVLMNANQFQLKLKHCLYVTQGSLFSGCRRVTPIPGTTSCSIKEFESEGTTSVCVYVQ